MKCAKFLLLELLKKTDEGHDAFFCGRPGMASHSGRMQEASLVFDNQRFSKASMKRMFEIVSASLEVYEIDFFSCVFEEEALDSLEIFTGTGREPVILGFMDTIITDARPIASVIAKNNNVLKLTLHGTQMSDGDMATIVQALATNTHLKVLKVTETGASENTWQGALAGVLVSNRSLFNLQLSGVTDEGLVALANGLKRNQGVHVLVLSQGRFRAPGLVALSEATFNLTSLSIFDTPAMGSEMHGLTVLVERSTKLMNLDIVHCRLTHLQSAILIKSIQSLRLLRSLNLEGNSIDSEEFRTLINFTRDHMWLREVDAYWTDVTLYEDFKKIVKLNMSRRADAKKRAATVMGFAGNDAGRELASRLMGALWRSHGELPQ